MSEMIERVALAIQDVLPAWLAHDGTAGDVDLARAAIEAMRSPTTPMLIEAADTVVVGCCALQMSHAEEVWQSMIAAALEPRPTSTEE